MTNEVEVALAKAVQELNATANVSWGAFLRALADHIEEVTEHCISAPPERLAECQGRARAMRDLFKTLIESPKLAAQMADKERRDAHARR